jgi:hypothetical protein
MLSFSDEYGTFQSAKEKYPEIMEILNSEVDEDNYIFVDMNMPNDGIFNLNLDNDNQIILVNFEGKYDYRGSAFFKVNNGKYSKSELLVPIVSKIDIKGEKYTLHNDRSEIQSNFLVVTYRFACKLPATFVHVGGCSDDEVATAVLSYKYKKGKFVLVGKILQELE